MAKRRSKRKSPTKTQTLTNQARPVQRDNFISQRNVLLDRSKKQKPFNFKLNTIEDRRTELNRRIPPPPKKLNSRPSKIETYNKNLVAKPDYRFRYKSTPGLRFRNPDQTVICWKRKIRRAVLFATKNTGKGSANKFRKYNEYSKVSCRR